MINHWVHCHKLAMQDIRYLNSMKIIKFEDLVANTDTVMKELQEFIGVNNVVHIPSDFSDSNIKYFELWEEHGRSIRKNLSISLSKIRFTDTLKEFGYSLEAPYYCEVSLERQVQDVSEKLAYSHIWRIERKLYKYLYSLGF